MKTITLPPQASPCLAAPLAFATAHAWHRVVDISLQSGSAKRLMDLGLTPGIKVYVASVSGSGIVVHLPGNLRLAVDATLAELVWVEPVAA